MHRRGDLLADRRQVHIGVGERNHYFQPRDGVAYVVTWTESLQPNGGGTTDVYAARLGQVTAISATPFDDAALFPFGLGGGRTLFAYNRLAPELATHRVFTRLFAPARVRAAR